MKPSIRLLGKYIEERYGADRGSVRVRPAGKGCHGEGFLVEFTRAGSPESLVVKSLDPAPGLGHDNPSDRAGVLLGALGVYGRLPGHVKAEEVIALGRDGSLTHLGDASEYYIVMERAWGEDYFNDLRAMAEMKSLATADVKRVRALARYLARIHKKKKYQPRLYLRRLRDTIGHGECLMGVFDTYGAPPPGFTSLAEMADIEKRCIELRSGLKGMAGRLSVVHGDFHPGNIMFTGSVRFRLLDRSRGEFGEPADDLTALAVNYVFFSLIRHGRMAGAYEEALALFFDEYIGHSGDADVLGVVQMFFAFRGAVVANPLFYPDVTDDVRSGVLAFVHGVLRADRFDPADVNTYINRGKRYRKRFA